MHFLMPHVFQSQSEFRDWFCNPLNALIEGGMEGGVKGEEGKKEESKGVEPPQPPPDSVVARLHNVLRPFLLRRMKKDVEKQLPGKFEHVVPCQLSRRQRQLYEDFMASSSTRATLASGNFLGLLNVLMQLRKVCNHPDLFAARPIQSPLDFVGPALHFPRLVGDICAPIGPEQSLQMVRSLCTLMEAECLLGAWEALEIARLATPKQLILEMGTQGEWRASQSILKGRQMEGPDPVAHPVEALRWEILSRRKQQRIARLDLMATINLLRCSQRPLIGHKIRSLLYFGGTASWRVAAEKSEPRKLLEVSLALGEAILTPLERLQKSLEEVEAFTFVSVRARAPAPQILPPPRRGALAALAAELAPRMEFLQAPIIRRQLFFPDRRLVQFDCGKLQELSILLRRLRAEGHRALIFTQMTRMLDVLENFICLYGYTYLR